MRLRTGKGRYLCTALQSHKGLTAHSLSSATKNKSKNCSITYQLSLGHNQKNNAGLPSQIQRL